MNKQLVTNTIQSNRFKELDALRGIAALMVVFFHLTIGRPEAKLGFKLGTTGVDLFFIISGFVIFMSLTKVKTSVDFIINRVSRLYPTYWVSVTFTFILILIASFYNNDGLLKTNIIHYLGNMTMFQFYLRIPNLDGPYWTMIIEMIFYLGILLLFHFKQLKYLNKIGITLSILVVILSLFFYNNTIIKNILTIIPLLKYIPLFFAGTVFYKIYSFKNKLFENYLILLLCLICQILLFNCLGKSHDFINQKEYAIMIVVYFGLFTLFVNDKLYFIVSKGTLFLGKISFALYLIHQYISIHVIIPYFTEVLLVNFWIASIFISLPVVIILASIITYYIEVPFSKKMKEKLKSKFS